MLYSNVRDNETVISYKPVPFRVYRRNASGKGKTIITTINYSPAYTAKEVKEKLVRNGWGKNIIVRKY